jgi:type IV pilus assembly protein PilY1
MSWVKHAVGAAVAAALAFAPIAHSDDTEIYLGNNHVSTVLPNVVFIIDTSGSMDSKVTTRTQYDPNITYDGSCNADRVYYSTTGKAPACSTSNWVETSVNYCKASHAALASTGIYLGRMAMWNRHNNSNQRKWVNFNNKWHDYEVECQADWETHGKLDGDGKTYPATGSSGPWSTGANKINWNSTGTSYTLYTGNYMNWLQTAASVTKTRLEIVQEVFGNIMDSTEDINVAAVRFSGSDGGYFVSPMLRLNDTPLSELGGKSSRRYLKDTVNAFTPNGMTPLTETLYEVALFYRGEKPKYGGTKSHVDCIDNGKYVSPIDYQCQKNFIVLLTDGVPTEDTGADSAIKALPSFKTVTGSSTCSGNCLDELAHYLYKKDQRDDLNDTQNVITYTVGFATDQELLSSAAKKGGGTYHTTNDAAGLTDAFTSILTEILAVNTTFTAPAVSVNAFNRLNHRDELYFALFRPSERPSWDGNIKRYQLGIPKDGTTQEVLDWGGATAVDPNTGFFKTTAKSFWSSEADGDVVSAGGAASKIEYPRSVYTDNGGTNPALISFTKTNVTAEMLGVATSARRDEVVDWARGLDILDEDADGAVDDPRTRMGDPLHTDPVLVTYGGTDAVPIMTVFATTNAGFLHAINANDGKELYSFIPSDLLRNLDRLYENTPSEAHPYGLDGPLGLWVKDVDGDGHIESGDHVYIYATMRRGGRNIYALDVTNRSAPSLKWVIKGGPDGTAGFEELGETWSQPVLARVKWGSDERTVLIFGGGYDENQENDTPADADTMGRAIYMVNADTGALLWWAGPHASASLTLADMEYSIPSTVRVIDINGDGLADRFYVGDMGARLWRFDVNADNTGAGNFATGGIIAKLGDSSAAGKRRFYYAPDVSLSPKKDFLNIAIGSGYRGHPLNTTIQDRFYVVRDWNVYSAPASYTPIDESNLYDATDNNLGEGTVDNRTQESDRDAAKEDLDNKHHGLYVKLNRIDNGAWEGEKVLAESITLENQVIFTTFTPVASNSAACAPSQGTAKTYIMSVLDATPTAEHDDIEGLTREDRHVLLVRGGIPPRPTVTCTGKGCIVLVGTEVPELGRLPIPLNPVKTRWWRKP